MPATATIGVRGLALCHQATSDLALALLRPTVPEHDIHRHQHADMHLILLLSGHYVSEAAGMPEVCTGPAVILNPPGTEHRDRFRSRDGRFLTLNMSAAAYRRFLDGVPAGDRPLLLPPQSLARALHLLAETRHWEASSPLAVESILSEIMADAQAPPPVSATGRLQRVVERLEDDASTPPTLQELTAIADVHPVYLARAFRKRFGIAPSDWLRRHRLHRAVTLISQKRTLADAAADLGFTDQSHLNRCFVAEFGMTPGAFRRLALGRGQVARIQDAHLRRR